MNTTNPLGWEADPNDTFIRRLGEPAWEVLLDPADPARGYETGGADGCPEAQLLESGDVFLQLRVAPESLLAHKPTDMRTRHDEVAGVIFGPQFETICRDYLAHLEAKRGSKSESPEQ
ncbi:hypothetical protein [Rhizocola hellebori]|uniref:hypothetical protein n=1 Tax=Rhizocola hellebori TaxID=1392758 RepID=UPI0019430A15|nr:hypothetical protein [Rhizocola hellebori]